MYTGELKSRRQFLSMLGWLAAIGLASESSGLAGLADGIEAEPGWDKFRSYRISPWTGDDYHRGHRLRDGVLPTGSASLEHPVDIVIVGGGMAGLASAYYLRNHNFLLLEQYDELGGQSRGLSFRGMDFSLAAAYLGSIDGLVGDLLSDLSLAPKELSPDKNSWLLEGLWYPGIKGRQQDLIYKEFGRLRSDLETLRSKSSKAELTSSDTEHTRLDSTPFSTYLKGYHPTFVSLLNSFSKSSFCGGIDQISVLAGLSGISDIFGPSWVFPGGNPALARALRAKIDQTGEGRMIPGSFVWKVTTTTDGASVIYQTKDGAVHQINAKHVIVTTPPLVATRIVTTMDDRTKADLLSLKYGSYLVANFCMSKKIFKGAYDNWVSNPFTFTDFIMAEAPYEAFGTYKPEMGSVMTVYQPYAPGSIGRGLLLAGDRAGFASSLADQFSQLIERFDRHLVQLILTRWGHAMVVPSPGFFTRLRRLKNANTPGFTLAHNSNAGLPSAESAIASARHAADRAVGKQASGSGLPG